MVGLLSGMDSEDRSSVALAGNEDVNVGVAEEDSNGHKQAPDENQPTAENMDNVDEVEHVKELKSILKQRGQYTFRKVKVDFDLIPKQIPYDENDYTIDIQIVEKEPVKIKSWAAIFAAKKAEAEAEAAAIAEADEALKKAEEGQKREAMKKANKTKLKKPEEHPKFSQESSGTLLTSERIKHGLATSDINPLEPTVTIDQTLEHIGAQLSHQSTNESLSAEQNENQEPIEASNEQQVTYNNTAPTGLEMTSEINKPCKPTEDYKLAESIVEEVLNAVVGQAAINQAVNLESIKFEQTPEQKDEEESSCTESLAAERSEHTNDDLEEISIHEEAIVSQSLEDSNAEISSSQEVSHSQVSGAQSDLGENLSEECSSVSRSEDESSKISHSEDTSKLVELQGKKVPRKVLVTAASLVEEILAEMPDVIRSEPKIEGSDEPIPNLNKKNESQSINVETVVRDSNSAKNKNGSAIRESGARRKRREFKKSSDSSIFEHVKRSLESAAPEILETAVGVLEEIEKIVVEKVGSAIP